MATVIKTRSAEILGEILSQHYQKKQICVVDQATIQEKTMLSFFENVERYALKRTPTDFYNGVAEKRILYPTFSLVFDYYLTPDKTYEPGSITAAVANIGRDYAAAAKTLSLINTKGAINNAVDIAMDMFLAMSQDKTDIVGSTRDFLWNLLNNKAFRTATNQRLTKSFTMLHPSKMNEEAVGELAAIITLGKGEAIAPQFFPQHHAIRSVILMGVKKMIDEALTTGKLEIFSDVLTVLSLFIIYINVTESDSVYDTAFPTLSANGANTIVYAKRLQGFKQLATIFSRVGFSAVAFDGNLTCRLMEETLKLFPDMLDVDAYVPSEKDAKGEITVDMSAISFIKESSARFSSASGVFMDILPTMFKGYVDKVIDELKAQTEADVILPTLFDDLQGIDQMTLAKVPIFVNLTAQYIGAVDKDGNPVAGSGLKTVLSSPDEANQLPPKALVSVSMKDIQTFLLTKIFPAINKIYSKSVTLRDAYDRVFKSLGTPTGSMISGVNIELEILDDHVYSGVPSISDMTGYRYSKLNERHLWPTVFPALLIDDALTQTWSLSHLKYEFVRPDLLALRFARDGVIDKMPGNLKLDYYNTVKAHERWSWLPSSLPVPSLMQNTAFAYTPIPFNYSYDSVYGMTKSKGEVMDKFMTRTGKIPILGYMTFGEVLSEYTTSGAVSKADLALSLSGLGFMYFKNEKGQWEFIHPHTPTIYGMPTIFFVEVNTINVNKALAFKGDFLYPKDPDVDGSDGSRIIYDRSQRRQGVGDVILVLHKYVPATFPLSYMIQTLRNGFTVRVPFLSAIYNKLFELAVKAIKTQFIKLGSKIDPDEPASKNSYVEINTAFNQVLTFFQTMPQGSAEDSLSAEQYYETYIKMNNMSYKAFKNYYFQEILGWSPVIVGYPHLTMTDRFVERFNDHFNSWLRPYSSRIYVDSAEMKNHEKMNLFTVAPDIIQQLVFEDEKTFITSTIDTLLVDTISRKEEGSSHRANAVAEGEAIIGDAMHKVETKGEGYEVTLDNMPKNPNLGDEITSSSKETVHKMDKSEKTNVMIPKYQREKTRETDTEVNLDDNKKISIDSVNKVIDESKTDPKTIVKNIKLKQNAEKENRDAAETELGQGDGSNEVDLTDSQHEGLSPEDEQKLKNEEEEKRKKKGKIVPPTSKTD